MQVTAFAFAGKWQTRLMVSELLRTGELSLTVEIGMIPSVIMTITHVILYQVQHLILDTIVTAMYGTAYQYSLQP
jgi:hypothetical protein